MILWRLIVSYAILCAFSVILIAFSFPKSRREVVLCLRSSLVLPHELHVLHEFYASHFSIVLRWCGALYRPYFAETSRLRCLGA